MKRRKSPRQGQTRYKVVVYDPGKIEGYDDQYVAMVYRCFVTAVRGVTVNYQCGAGPYLCGRSWFLKNTEPTFNKAMRKARAAIAKVEGGAA